MSQFIADSVWYRTQFWSSFVVAFLPYLCISLCRINENVCIHAESHNHFSLFISHIFVFFFWWFWKIRHQGQTCKIAHITCYRSTVTTTKQTDKKRFVHRRIRKENEQQRWKTQFIFSIDFWSVKAFSLLVSF